MKSMGLRESHQSFKVEKCGTVTSFLMKAGVVISLSTEEEQSAGRVAMP